MEAVLDHGRVSCMTEEASEKVMKNVTYIIDMNDTYPEDLDKELGDSGNNDTIVRISMKDISGRNMYCSDEAFEEIRSRLSAYEDLQCGIHFIDTGNYHYMTRIITSFISERYDLILFDHHTDMQDTAFGGILSCGSWVKEILEKDEHVNSVLIVGPPEPIPGGCREVIRYPGGEACGYRYYRNAPDDSRQDPAVQSDIPVYVSIDKDILDRSECITNWDQGELSLEELSRIVTEAVRGRRIIGADICGGISVSDPEYDSSSDMINTRSDVRMYELCRELMTKPAD